MKPTQLYKLNAGFARHNKLPIYFVAVELIETARAVYLVGQGTTETAKMGVCCVCGRGLTHPVSVELGIGPECGGHYHDWKAVGGYTLENVARLTKLIREDIKIDSWVPKSMIKDVLSTIDVVTVPNTHPMLKPREIAGKEAKIIEYSDGRQMIKITFPFDRELIDKVKQIEGRRYHDVDGKKYWTCPLTLENARKVRELQFATDEAMENYLEQQEICVDDMPDQTEDINGLGMQLFPYQVKGVNFLDARNGRAIIADEMGLGKTAQALAWLQKHPTKRPVIIVVPASLKLNWKREAAMWMSNPNVQILQGTTPGRITGEIIIVNYDILFAWVDMLKSIKPQVLILDECHYVKNNAAKRTKAVKMLSKATRHIIALSGTPIVNRPVEVYNAIRLVEPTLFPNFMSFAMRYCNAKHNGYGWDFSGSKNTEELHDKLKNSIMIRRLKADVLTDLPAKMRSYVPIELDNYNEYRKAEQNFIEFVRESKGAQAAARASNAQALAEIEGLKQLAVQGKLKQSIEWIKDALEANGKLIVFAVHKFVIEALMQEFKGIAVKIDGSVSGENRQAAVDAFQTDPNIQLFVGNIKAAGVGITLTASSKVVFLELPWTPGELSQAEDRAHRIGQTDNVMIYYLLAESTIEDRISRLIDSKRQVLDSVLDGVESDPTSLLSELMNEYTN